MKKLLVAMAVLLAFLPASAIAEQNTTVSRSDDWDIGGGVQRIVVTWEGHASGGAVLDGTFNLSQPCWMTQGLTDPGATSPTADYDIVVTDAYGVDIFGATLNDRSDTASEQAAPLIGTPYGDRLSFGAHTITFTNQSVNSAVGTLVLDCVLAR